MSAAAKAVLKEGREKSLRRRHPWIFSGALARLEGTPEAGAAIEVLSASGEFLARAGYSPASQIRLRVWTFDAPEKVDARLLRARLERAIEARRVLGLLEEGSACRLVFGESDDLPGLIVDRYGRFLVCQFLAACIEPWRDTVVALLGELMEPAGIYERSESGVRHKEGLSSRQGLLLGEAPPPLLAVASGPATLLVDIAHGQKTGAYLDQQRNRMAVAEHAANAEVLDAFAYSGAFAMSCLKHGATAATLLEASGEALQMAHQQAALNGVGDRCRYIQGDVFTELRRLRESGASFDMVILDPPKFVHSADQLGAGSRGYKDINWLGMQLVRAGGLLATFSCSGHLDAALFQKIVAGAALDAGRSVQIVSFLGQPADHPVALHFPESAYLKGLLLRVW